MKDLFGNAAKKWKDMGRNRQIGLVAGAFVLLAVLAGGLAWYFTSAGVSLTALQNEKNGIALDTEFMLVCSTGLTKEQVQENLVFQPETPFDIYENAPGNFKISPKKPLKAGIELKAEFMGRSFEFKVQNLLQVTKTTPKNAETDVVLSKTIEIEFSTDAIGAKSANDAFTISPPTPGLGYVADGVFVYRPDQPFLANTEYTVTLADTLVSKDGLQLAEPYTYSFTTGETLEAPLPLAQEPEPKPERHSIGWITLYGNTVEQSCVTGEAPVFVTNGPEETTEQDPVDVNVYAFNSMEEYTAELQKNISKQAYSGHMVDVSALRHVGTYSVLPQHLSTEQGYSYYWALPFTEPLEQGWYIVEFAVASGMEKKFPQRFLQVSDLSVFTTQMGGSLIAWVNDSAAGMPAEGAKIVLDMEKDVEAVTKADGTAEMKIPQPDIEEESWRQDNIYTVQHNGRVYVGVNSFTNSDYEYESFAAVKGNYAVKVYTDRENYKPGDTVKLWGIMASRDTGLIPQPRSFKLVVTGEDAAEVQQETIKLASDGKLNTGFVLDNLKSGSYNLNFYMGDALVYILPVVVHTPEYEGLKYNMSVRTDPPVLLMDGKTPVKFIVDAEKPDGTPAANLILDFHTLYQDLFPGENKYVKTDENGHAELSKVISPENTWSTMYRLDYSFGNDSLGEARGTLYGLTRDAVISGELVGENKLKVRTNSVDFDSMPENGYLFDESAAKGAPLDMDLKAEIYEETQEKKDMGEVYDIVTREKYTEYEYSDIDTVIKTLDIRTVNGEYIIDGLPPKKENTYRYVVFTGKDSKGMPVEYTFYIDAQPSLYGAKRYLKSDYWLDIANKPAGDNRTANGQYSTQEAAPIAAGSDLELTLMKGDLPVNVKGGKILYAAAKYSFIKTGISSEGSFKIPFERQMAPGFVISAAYFDGKNVYHLRDTRVDYSTGEQELAIDIKTGKETYKPGDKVTLTVDVTNSETGRPAAGAPVLLMLTDEMNTKDSYNDVDTLPPGPGTNNSVTGVGALDFLIAKGPMFEDYKLTPGYTADRQEFITAVADGKGRASFSFTLPPHIANWIILASAIGEDGYVDAKSCLIYAGK